jgi:hydroxymethylpyrimidine pyrophosphatase-like HAD family hydrolase
MRFHALATDYDGTLAHDGRMDPPTVAALERARAAGRKLVLVTGRVLPELLQMCHRLDLFDLAVIENGAVLYSPAARTTRVLAPPPPPTFAEDLRKRGVHPVGTGEVIVATFQPHQDTVAAVIRESGQALEVILNKDAVMVLPRGVDKAFGLAPALSELGLTADRVVAVGDAENDHTFLKMCGFSAAVANALPDLKAAVHHVTRGRRGAGVAELIDLLLADALGG